MDYQKYCCLIEESVELAKRLFKLNKFIENDTFKELTEIEKNLLNDQFDVMHAYLRILHRRIQYYATQNERSNNG